MKPVETTPAPKTKKPTKAAMIEAMTQLEIERRQKIHDESYAVVNAETKRIKEMAKELVLKLFKDDPEKALKGISFEKYPHDDYARINLCCYPLMQLKLDSDFTKAIIALKELSNEQYNIRSANSTDPAQIRKEMRLILGGSTVKPVKQGAAELLADEETKKSIEAIIASSLSAPRQLTQ